MSTWLTTSERSKHTCFAGCVVPGFYTQGHNVSTNDNLAQQLKKGCGRCTGNKLLNKINDGLSIGAGHRWGIDVLWSCPIRLSHPVTCKVHKRQSIACDDWLYCKLPNTMYVFITELCPGVHSLLEMHSGMKSPYPLLPLISMHSRNVLEQALSRLVTHTACGLTCALVGSMLHFHSLRIFPRDQPHTFWNVLDPFLTSLTCLAYFAKSRSTAAVRKVVPWIEAQLLQMFLAWMQPAAACIVKLQCTLPLVGR